jgi:hypothetical protein
MGVGVTATKTGRTTMSTGYRLHIEGVDAEPTAHATMESVHAEQRRLARQYGRTAHQIEALSYIITEAEYQAERAEAEYQQA